MTQLLALYCYLNVVFEIQTHALGPKYVVYTKLQTYIHVALYKMFWSWLMQVVIYVLLSTHFSYFFYHVLKSTF